MIINRLCSITITITFLHEVIRPTDYNYTYSWFPYTEIASFIEVKLQKNIGLKQHTRKHGRMQFENVNAIFN